MSTRERPSDQPRSVRAPQRLRGELRVNSLLEAADALIAEKGFDATTMGEIAARAGAQIGSLYRFFPNKRILAEALIQRFEEQINTSFRGIEATVLTMSIEHLADSILEFMVQQRDRTRSMVALLQTRSDFSEKRYELRKNALAHIARIVKTRAPTLDQEEIDAIAIVLMLNMKAMIELVFDQQYSLDSPPTRQLREMNRLYLASRIKKAGGGSSKMF